MYDAFPDEINLSQGSNAIRQPLILLMQGRESGANDDRSYLKILHLLARINNKIDSFDRRLRWNAVDEVCGSIEANGVESD